MSSKCTFFYYSDLICPTDGLRQFFFLLTSLFRKCNLINMYIYVYIYIYIYNVTKLSENSRYMLHCKFVLLYSYSTPTNSVFIQLLRYFNLNIEMMIKIYVYYIYNYFVLVLFWLRFVKFSLRLETETSALAYGQAVQSIRI